MALRKYIIITPCKNEEDSLPLVAESIIKQTIQPALWVIVDDCSNDNTPGIINNLKREYDWVKNANMDRSESRNLGLHIAQVYINGFKFAKEWCLGNNIEYEYIGIVDADMVLQTDYFEKLIEEFEVDRSLGLCSGHGYYILNGKTIWEDFRDDFPTGSARLWKKRCFDETGGYVLTCSPDGVSAAKARLKGWKIRRFKNIIFSSTRADNGAEGLWKGYKQFAFNNYYVGYTCLHGFLKGMKIMTKYPYYPGLAYLFSFFTSYLLRKDKINDKEVKRYYKNIGNERLKELLYLKLSNSKKT